MEKTTEHDTKTLGPCPGVMGFKERLEGESNGKDKRKPGLEP